MSDGSVEWVPAESIPYFRKPSFWERLFGVVSRKKVIAQAMKIYLNEDTSKARNTKDLYYRMGNANALDNLCSWLGIDLTAHIKRENGKG